VSAITPAWDRQFESMNLNPEFASRMSQRLRHWLPHLLASLLVNLILLTLFPRLLEPGFSDPQLPPIEVTLSSSKARESVKKPLEEHLPTPVKTKSIEKPVEKEPAPDATPVPKPQPRAITRPPPMPKPAETEKKAIVEPEKNEIPIESTVEETDSPSPLKPVQSPPANVSPPPIPKATPLYKLTRMPQFVEQQTPMYPESERAMGRETKVLAEVFIDAEGDVVSIKIIQSGGQDFDQAVTDALRASRFQPAYVGKQAVAVRFQIPFEFQLD
jgi:TonB family protein